MKIIPHMYKQDSSQSITKNGKYDYHHFSWHEADVIRQVLKNVMAEYPPDIRSIGLVSEAYSIIYKPRHILFKVVIELYAASDAPLDLLAVALVYKEEGAYYRKLSIACFERFFAVSNNATPYETLYIFSCRYLYDTVSKLYEQEKEYGMALHYAVLSLENSDESGVDAKFETQERIRRANQIYDEKRIAALHNKLQQPQAPVKELHMGDKRRQLEDDILNAARFFIEDTGFSCE